jgi:hypothetical protein
MRKLVRKRRSLDRRSRKVLPASTTKKRPRAKAAATTAPTSRARKSVAYSAATEMLGEAVRQMSFQPGQFHWVMEYLLTGIQAELSAMFPDSRGNRFNAFLWEEDPKNDKNLVILTCAAESAFLYRSFPKIDLLTWQAMHRDRPMYDRDRRFRSGEPWGRYRAVAAFPIRCASHGNQQDSSKPVAGISIKSTQPNHFDDRVNEIYSTLKPVLSLIALVLQCRAAFDKSPSPGTGSNGKNHKGSNRRQRNRRQ